MTCHVLYKKYPESWSTDPSKATLIDDVPIVGFREYYDLLTWLDKNKQWKVDVNCYVDTIEGF